MTKSRDPDPDGEDIQRSERISGTDQDRTAALWRREPMPLALLQLPLISQSIPVSLSFKAFPILIFFLARWRGSSFCDVALAPTQKPVIGSTRQISSALPPQFALCHFPPKLHVWHLNSPTRGSLMVCCDWIVLLACTDGVD